MISERVFLAFDTGRGLAYVQASGWQRAYLLWTFRNFRGLPHKILNARQRELVEKLYPTASFNLAHQLDEATVIGTVDDFRLQRPAPVPVSAVAEKLLPSVPAKKFADVLIRNRSEQIQALYARLAFSGLTRRVGAGALVAVMVVLGWQQLRSRPVVSASTASSAAKMRPRGQNRPEKERAKGIDSVVVPPPTNEGYQQLSLAQIASTVPITATPLPPLSVRPTTSQSPKSFRVNQQASNRRWPNQRVLSAHSIVADLADTQDGSTALPRMRISGPPRKIVYPDCPDSARGKVSLQAVVGYDGTVSQVRVLTGNRSLAVAAARAIRQWRYQPFSGDAQKVERETRITVSFISGDVVAVSFPDTAPVSR